MAGMNYSLLPPNSGPIPVQIAETDADAVIAGGDHFGWVSGSISGLLAGQAATVVFDLGPLWFRYIIAAFCIQPQLPSTGLSAIQCSGSDIPAHSSSRRLKAVESSSPNTLYAGVTSAAGPQQVIVRPIGRYLIILVTNADPLNAQGTGAKITLAVYPS